MQKNIVLLHGWGANTRKLQALASSLETKGWKVLIPEIPGFGAPEPDSVWGVGDYSKFVLNLASSFFKKDKYFIFGHSFGGRVAIKMSLAENVAIRGIILCSTGGISRGFLVKRVVFKGLASLGRAFGNRWKALLYKLAREHDYERASNKMKKVFQKVIAEDLKPLISKIKFPVLVLWGEEDKITPVKDAYFIANNSKRASIFTYKNEGHRLPYEKSDEVAEKIDQWVGNF
ncbi:MAG: alpha/beta hydrolase [Candidatus Blackburnbacteria bacterium]|nr:alpha/beta hydrolase [Candidatus Blackburnbacteria bacterium]